MDTRSSKINRCPFRGLEVSREEDHQFFFAREAVALRLMDKLHNNRFMAVVGPSGCGKSSKVGQESQWYFQGNQGYKTATLAGPKKTIPGNRRGTL